MVADADPAMLREIYITEALYEEMTAESMPQSQREVDLAAILVKTESIRTIIVTEEVYRKISDTTTPQGVLAEARMPQDSLSEILHSAEDPLFLLCEDIQDPGNLGTMIRTAEAAGVTGIILSKGCVDPYHPKVVRATMTAIFREPILVVEDLRAAMRELQTHGVQVYAAHLDAGQTTLYDQPDYHRAAAFLIGNEGNGLREETAAAADMRIRIPMAGHIESLNAAMSAGILMYEAARQRRTPIMMVFR